jgi:D-3-phosphoglycerate dehydrogenase
MKILFLDSTHPLLEQGLKDAGHDLAFDFESDEQTLTAKLAGVNGLILRSRMRIDRELLVHANDLKFIGRFGAGLENVDVAYAESKGIPCIRVPEGNRDAVGEQAVGMLLALFNHLKRADAEVRQGHWLRKENTGLELQGKTVGVIGYGYMGSAFVEKLKGFGVTVLIYDKYKSQYAPDWAFETGLQAIFENADVLSLHVPLTEETYYMVNRDFLLQFRKPIYLINTARGPVVETAALVEALKSRKVLGACLDVLEYEKTSFENLFETDRLPEPLNFLLQAENVLLSPHIAGWSKESFAKMARVMLDKISRISRVD